MSRPGEPIVVIGAKLVYATTYNQFVLDFRWVSSKPFGFPFRLPVIL